MSDLSFDTIGTAAHIKQELVKAAVSQARRTVGDLTALPRERLEAIYTIGNQLNEIMRLPGWKIVEKLAVDCMEIGNLMLADDADLPKARVQARGIAKLLARIEQTVAEGERAYQLLQKKDVQQEIKSADPDALIDPRQPSFGK